MSKNIPSFELEKILKKLNISLKENIETFLASGCMLKKLNIYILLT